METKTFQYHQKTGWTIEDFPDLDSENTLILVFAAPMYYTEKEPFEQLRSHYQKSMIIGCSTAGEIIGPRIQDESVVVVVTRFAKTKLKLAMAEVKEPKDSFSTGKGISKTLQGDKLHNVFVLAEGLLVNGSELVRGLCSDVPEKVILSGGLAGDGSCFSRTWVLYQGEVLDSHVVAVGFYGDNIQVGHAQKGGWDPFGPVRNITRSQGNVLYELDNKPALALYKEYLGEKAEELPSSGLLFPLAIHDPNEHDAEILVRTILGVDEDSQSLIFAGDIPLGYEAQLMRSNFDRLIDSANDASTAAWKSLSKHAEESNNVLLLAVSCVGRRLLLGERTEEETESTLENMTPGTIQAGFYSYGEISPGRNVGHCELHNQTMTLTLIYET